MLEQETRKASLADNPAVDWKDPAVREQWWEESLRSGEFMSAHYQEFFQKYPGQWVGVYLEELVAVAPTFRELVEQAEAQGVPHYILRIKFMGKLKGPRCWTPFLIKRRS